MHRERKPTQMTDVAANRERTVRLQTPKQPRINLRLFLYPALGLVFGIFLYCRIRLGGIGATDFVFFILFLALSLRPLSKKRLLTIALSFLLFAGAGAGLMHWYTERYNADMAAGEYEITGTVVSFTVDDEETQVVLDHLAFDGKRAGGRMSATLPSDSVRAGDIVTFTAFVSHLPPPSGSYAVNLFVKDIRYSVSVVSFRITGTSRNLLLRLNARCYDVLHGHMDGDAADVAYALLTGNSGGMDDGLATAVRQGGIAHIFAVSGLHIGILYGAVALALKRFRRVRVLPASALAFVYAAFCGFTVSSVRAAVMCTALGAMQSFGRKYDFIESISFAAVVTLLIRPAEWLSAGFRLSFGACCGLALFSGTIKRGLERIKCPAFLADYLAANVAVQLFTFPILFETFGYYSVWGTLLNLFLIPVLPVLFLGLFVCTMLALIIPPAAPYFCAVPNGMLSALVYLFSVADFSFVLKGFSLGAGAAVWTVSAVFLSERVRLGRRARIAAASFLAVLFSACLIVRNAVWDGCKLIAADNGMLLVRTRDECVLILGGSANLSSCEKFLAQHYGGTLTAVVAFDSDGFRAVNTALSLDTNEIRLRTEKELGLWETNVVYGETFTYGGLIFRYETESKLTIVAENSVVEIDFGEEKPLFGDLFITRGTVGTYYLHDGKIYKLSQ